MNFATINVTSETSIGGVEEVYIALQAVEEILHSPDLTTSGSILG